MQYVLSKASGSLRAALPIIDLGTRGSISTFETDACAVMQVRALLVLKLASLSLCSHEYGGGGVARSDARSRFSGNNQTLAQLTIPGRCNWHRSHIPRH